jgi:DNA-binding response OmpR family regulator
MFTILLLDDDRIFRRLVVEVLEQRGYRVLQAGRAAEADRLLEEEHADLLLVDGLLPDITGVQWIEKLRSTGRQTQVLLITSFWKSMRDFAVAAKTLGSIEMVRKPVEPQELADRVDTALRANRTKRR